MKKVFLLLIVLGCATANAQLKNIAQLVSYSTMTYAQYEASLDKTYWKGTETGKMDTLTYTRWVPQVLNEKNMGDCYMAFYKKKSSVMDYIVYQTVTKEVYQKFMAEVKNSGYKFSNTEKQKDKVIDYYVKDKYILSIIQGKEKPNDPLMYIFGVKVMKPSDLKNMQKNAPKNIKK